MKKRAFLGSTLLAGLSAGTVAMAAPSRASTGPALLTITGALSRTNRPPLDAQLDVMMSKQKLAFTKAFALDFAALAALPATTIRPTLEYDGKVHALRGPLLHDVLRAAGANPSGQAAILLRAVDGYAVTVTAAEAAAYRMIVATHMDGRPMALGGLGPLWAVLDADRIPELARKPLPERFAKCPWALYHIDVAA